MSAQLFALLPFLAGAAVVAALVGRFVLEGRRRERLMRDCLARGWTYVGRDDSLVDRWPGEPFRRGEHRRASNVVTGQAGGRPFVAFDYSYQTSTTDSNGHRSTTTHRYSVCAVALPGPLGRVAVVPDSVLQRAAALVGLGQDISLESEAFNRRYRVSADQPKLAYDVLHPRTVEYLLSVPATAWRIEGADLVSWASGRLEPADVVARSAVLARVAAGVPAFVWRDHGYDPRP